MCDDKSSKILFLPGINLKNKTNNKKIEDMLTTYLNRQEGMIWALHKLKDNISSKWIAVDFILTGLENHLNKFLKELPEGDVSEDDARKFVYVFVYNNDKIYNEDATDKNILIGYIKILIKLLKCFEKVICLRDGSLSDDEIIIVQYYEQIRKNLELLKEDSNKYQGTILITPSSLNSLSNYYNNSYTVFINNKKKNYFIESMNYKIKENNAVMLC
tara:strand:+ start:1159 stop:1806 length:648 start_codon:yes stop_codon:yes gene_type:complete